MRRDGKNSVRTGIFRKYANCYYEEQSWCGKGGRISIKIGILLMKVNRLVNR